MKDLPDSVLFACNLNAVRSPMAEALMKHLFGRQVYVDSAGVHRGAPDSFVVAAMEEIGIDISRHRAKTFDELEDESYDLVISLTPEAQHQAVEMTRTSACEIEYWPTMDPSAVQGSREQILDAYRGLRDDLMRRIAQRFGRPSGPRV
jgi:protein-tyrosine-phosphatase